MADCFVVEIPQSFSHTDQETAEIWPIRSRFADRPEPQPKRKRRSAGGANFSSSRDLRSNRKNKDIQRACKDWYNNAVRKFSPR